jgi:hypothetical protein
VPDSLSQPAISTQYIQVEVLATNLDGSAYDPSADVVQVAFVPESYPPGSPGPGDWITAQWEQGPGGTWWAAILVGPANGGVTLASGSYVPWVRVTDSPAIPALPGPLLAIT